MKAFGENVQYAVTDEIRLALVYAMKFTPPKNLAQGRTATKRDILRTMRPITPEELTQSKSLARIVKRRDIAAFNQASKYFHGTLKNAVAVNFEVRIHIGQRDRRGRVRPSRMESKTLVLGREQRGLLSKYIKRRQDNVGIAKNGWWAALQATFGTAPSWVTRHGTTAGEVVNDLNREDFPTITLINKTEWGAREGSRILGDALRARAGMLERKINAQLKAMNAS